MSKPTKLIVFLGGLFLGAVGLLIAGIGLLGIVDPVGSKMSDDADPFGPITTFDYIWGTILIVSGVVVTAAGTYLIWRIERNHELLDGKTGAHGVFLG